MAHRLFLFPDRQVILGIETIELVALFISTLIQEEPGQLKIFFLPVRR